MFASLKFVFNCDVNRIFWSSKQFEGKTTHTEPWYGTPYIVECIDDDLVKVRSLWVPDKASSAWTALIHSASFFVELTQSA